MTGLGGVLQSVFVDGYWDFTNQIMFEDVMNLFDTDLPSVGNRLIHGYLYDSGNDSNIDKVSYLQWFRGGVDAWAEIVIPSTEWNNFDNKSDIFGSWLVTAHVNAVPEPSTLAIFALGIIFETI